MGRIIVPENTFALPTTRVGGFMRARIHRGKSGTLKYDTGWFRNLITDAGIGYYAYAPTGGAYGKQRAIYGQCAVGTGSGTPAYGDSTLFSYLTKIYASGDPSGTTWNNQTGSGYTAAVSPTPAYYWSQNQFVFPTGAAAGNLTEIGIFPCGVTYGSGLYSHALILDNNGNPTSITVLADEVLTVTYQVNYYIDTVDHAFSFPLNGSTNTGTYRTMNMGKVPSIPSGGFSGGENNEDSYPQVVFWAQDIQPITSQPSGSYLSSSGSYVQFVNDMANSGTWYSDWAVNIGTSTSAFTILSMTYSLDFIQYQFGALETPVVKSIGQQLSASFRASWGRYSG